jgi:hypothetical protein
MIDLRRKRNYSRTVECLRQSRKDHEVGVKLDALQAANAERCKRVVVFEPSELALNGYAVLVEGAEAFAVAGDTRVVAVEKVAEREACGKSRRL